MPAKSEPPVIRLRDVETDDLPLFFENRRDPVAVAMVAYHSRDRAKVPTDETILKRTIVLATAASADSPGQDQVAGNINSWTSYGKREVDY